MTTQLTDATGPFDAIDVAVVRQEIERIGYMIVPNVVATATLSAMRDFWLAEFSKPCPRAPMVWGPYLGEPNGTLYDDGPTLSLYRSFDYLWNPPFHTPTRTVALALNRVRNELIGEENHYGELLNAERYGIYVTTSYYPCGSGWMHMHPDTAGDRKHWHFILPLTFREQDYDSGGLILMDRKGDRVDMDGLAEPGCVIFYDGTLEHGVEKIEGGEGTQTGRLQMFAIPTYFDLPAANQRQIETISGAAFLHAKLSRLKRRLTKGSTR